MAVTNGAIGGVHPETDKTLKLENVRVKCSCATHY